MKSLRGVANTVLNGDVMDRQIPVYVVVLPLDTSVASAVGPSSQASFRIAQDPRIVQGQGVSPTHPARPRRLQAPQGAAYLAKVPGRSPAAVNPLEHAERRWGRSRPPGAAGRPVLSSAHRIPPTCTTCPSGFWTGPERSSDSHPAGTL